MFMDLFPLMIEINLWAEKYYDIPAERKAILREVKKNKEKFINTAIKELKKVVANKVFKK